MPASRDRCGRLVVLAIILCCYSVLDATAATSDALPPPGYGLRLHPGQTLAVIGLRQESKGRSPADRETLQDRRISFGLNTMLAQELYDTGKFHLVEDRDVHARQIIANLVSAYWLVPRPVYSELDLRQVAAELDVELLAYGGIAYSVVSTQRLGIGPLTRVVQKLDVTVNLCVFHTSAQMGLCQDGQGIAKQEGVGVVYEFRNDRLDFEKNALGKATKQAVAQAVQELMAGIYFAE
jgi:hypothetical protein